MSTWPACKKPKSDADLVFGDVQNFEARQRRRFRARAHVDPDHTGPLDRPVGVCLDLLLEIRRRHARHVQAVAGDVEFPAVIDAAQSAFLVASEKQRGAAMRAAVIHHADMALAVAEGDELFAEQHQTDRGTVGNELGRHQCGDPVTAHQFAHDSTGADARQFHPVLGRRHLILPMRSVDRP
jgi:hypothetical protein